MMNSALAEFAGNGNTDGVRHLLDLGIEGKYSPPEQRVDFAVHREAEVPLWIAQGKSNADIATILGCAENTVKVHIARIFEKLGFENRHAATVQALEALNRPTPRK